MKGCEWSEDEEGNWWTGCDEAFCLTDGTPTENGMKFCCYCGEDLIEVRFSHLMGPNDDDDDTEMLK